ncbi:MAG: CarD family transcriptional regulator [Rickettsiales bacterium]|jgi:CarD family transcriptional regulator|nr:CarD family transcriptional regulator [Rickettsiales bacterium]
MLLLNARLVPGRAELMVFSFKVNDYCVYRTHGVARIVDIQEVNVGGVDTKCLILMFEKEKLTLSVPMKFKENGDIRKLTTPEEMEKVFEVLRGGTRKSKGMWSRRAKEYRDKINSGDVFQTAEVLRDLVRDVEEADRSYSERSIYDTAIYRLASEYAAIRKIPYDEAERSIVEVAKEKIKFSDIEAIRRQG